MEKHRRADRRAHAERVAKKRAKYWNRLREITPKLYGKFRSNHCGCGCWMCKPHKYDKALKYRISERKRLQSDCDE